jgi:hypothetical protein
LVVRLLYHAQRPPRSSKSFATVRLPRTANPPRAILLSTGLPWASAPVH